VSGDVLRRPLGDPVRPLVRAGHADLDPAARRRRRRPWRDQVAEPEPDLAPGRGPHMRVLRARAQVGIDEW